MSAILGTLVGTIIGASLAMLTTRAVVDLQWEREAALRRKDSLYVRIADDTAYVLERLREGHDVAAGPWFVYRIETQQLMGDPFSALHPARSNPQFVFGQQVQASAVKNELSHQGQQLLAVALSRIEAYNDAKGKIQREARTILAPLAQAEIDGVANSEELARWRKEHEGPPVTSQQWSEESRTEGDWLVSFAQAPPTGGLWAELWTNDTMQGGAPDVLGWLLADRVDEAVQVAYRHYRPGYMPPPPPREMFEQILQEGHRRIKAGAAYATVHEARARLVDALSALDTRIARGLETIQRHYTGGEPLV